MYISKSTVITKCILNTVKILTRLIALIAVSTNYTLLPDFSNETD